MSNNSNSSENINVSTDTEKSDFFLHKPVVVSCSSTIAERFDTLCKERGITFADFYNAVGIDKGNASRFRRGLVIPATYLRVKIAKFFGVDSSVIWDIPPIISAAKMEEAKNVNSN